MKKESKISVKMFRIVGDYAPLVRVDYLDKDAQEHSGLLLLDSCSTVNVLSSEIVYSMGPLCNKEGESTDIITSTNTVLTLDSADFSFTFGGVQFQESFCINDHQLPSVAGDLPLIGILGNLFLLKHQLVVDYSDFSVHTSEVCPDNLSISDCDFFVPMGLGFEYYGLPVLPIIQGENQIVTMADTGASFNVIAKQTINDNGFECHYLEETDSISGIGGTETEAEEAIVSFKLMTLTGGEVSVEEISRRCQFKVTPYYPYPLPQGRCDKNGYPLPPVEAIVSSPFMAKEGWILDFGAGIIYRRKQSALLKEAV